MRWNGEEKEEKTKDSEERKQGRRKRKKSFGRGGLQRRKEGKKPDWIITCETNTNGERNIKIKNAFQNHCMVMETGPPINEGVRHLNMHRLSLYTHTTDIQKWQGIVNSSVDIFGPQQSGLPLSIRSFGLVKPFIFRFTSQHTPTLCTHHWRTALSFCS